MTSNYKYSLEKGSKKYYCPQCGKKTFVRYKDNSNNDYLPENYGRCDRSDKCKYDKNPYKDGYCRDQVGYSRVVYTNESVKEIKAPIYFNQKIFTKTLNESGYTINTFLQNLLNVIPFPFDQSDVFEVAELYSLGTVRKGGLTGATTFPFIDLQNNVRAIQVKKFDKLNHTVKTTFLHSLIKWHYLNNGSKIPEWLQSYYSNEKILTCLFGEHLLKQFPENPIALVEAPKTAIYGTLYFGLPNKKEDLIWLAVYSKDTFTLDKLQVLKNRKVIVFPDLSKDGSTYKAWEEKAARFALRIPGVKFYLSNLLENAASEEERYNGLDLADYLIVQDWRLFRS
jgi:predicted RNA-binding Zn-ribbon protein involved in translation (DUF1610 family)